MEKASGTNWPFPSCCPRVTMTPKLNQKQGIPLFKQGLLGLNLVPTFQNVYIISLFMHLAAGKFTHAQSPHLGSQNIYYCLFPSDLFIYFTVTLWNCGVFASLNDFICSQKLSSTFHCLQIDVVKVNPWPTLALRLTFSDEQAASNHHHLWNHTIKLELFWIFTVDRSIDFKRRKCILSTCRDPTKP